MIKVIVELTAKPGQRAELRRLLEAFIEKHGPGTPGYLGSTRYEVVDQPDVIVELADWESVEARDRHMNALAESGALAPLGELVGAPFRVTVIRPLT